jgi:hypothetical protein
LISTRAFGIGKCDSSTTITVSTGGPAFSSLSAFAIDIPPNRRPVIDTIAFLARHAVLIAMFLAPISSGQSVDRSRSPVKYGYLVRTGGPQRPQNQSRITAQDLQAWKIRTAAPQSLVPRSANRRQMVGI